MTAPVVDPARDAATLAAGGAAARARGLLEIVIDEQGRVISAPYGCRCNPTFDQALLVAARDWSYSPATLNGQPVKFRKMIQVVTR